MTFVIQAIPCLARSGREHDLAAVTERDIDWPEIAEALAAQPRFGKRHCGPPYSVAQHCAMGADALWRETADATLAAQFLLHDAHEAYIGDFQTPVMDWFALVARRLSPTAANHCPQPAGCVFALAPSAEEVVHGALEQIKAELDKPIYARAGLAHYRDTPFSAMAIPAMDQRMCRAEARFLFGPQACADWGADPAPPPRLTGSLKPWGWAKAAEAWLERFDRFVGRGCR